MRVEIKPPMIKMAALVKQFSRSAEIKRIVDLEDYYAVQVTFPDGSNDWLACDKAITHLYSPDKDIAAGIERKRLAHHGIRGQKWGVRNGPPYPLNRTESHGGHGPLARLKEYARHVRGSSKGPNREAIIRLKAAAKTKKDVDDIIASMSREDKHRIGIGEDFENDGYLTIEQGEYVMKRVIKKVDDVPVAFIDLLDDGDTLNVCIGTRSGEQYRHKGYGSEVAKEAIDWFDANRDKLPQKKVVWGVLKDNAASIAIAEKNGFVFEEGSENDGWVNYVYDPDAPPASNHLAHHGIRGQRWGVRHGPPYPLDRKVSQRVRGQAEYTVRYKKATKSEKDEIHKAMTTDNHHSNHREFSTYEKFVMGQTQKAIDKYVRKRRFRNKLDDETGLYLKKGEGSIEKDADAVNYGYTFMDPDRIQNCVLCSVSYDLRRRGYEVCAKGAEWGYADEDIFRWYPDAQWNYYNSVRELKKDIVKDGNARGNLVFDWKSGGGHSISYEVQNGKLILIDGQSGNVYRNPDTILSRIAENDIGYVRLDNLEPDWDLLQEVVN